ncbi:MAG: serine hydrolase [Pseudomonadota bacterium]|nr:serine hydrolase [Pseudomonadota bacterium]
MAATFLAAKLKLPDNSTALHRRISTTWLPVFALLAILNLPTAAVSAEGFPKLRDSVDPVLQQQLEDLVRGKGLNTQVDGERLALALVDISDLRKPRLASLNGDTMEYAASLPKLAILLAAFVQIEAGKLELDSRLESDLVQMIRHSSNPAATRVLDRVGREELLQILQSPRFKFYDKKTGGGLWVGKAYAKKGAYHRDPLHNLSHGATVFQVARFYYLLETNRLVGPELTRKMKQILSKPAIEHKFVKGLKARPGVQLYRKSGTWKQFHADCALVEYGQHKYIIVGLAEHPRGGQWLTDLAAPLHDLIVTKQSNK